MGKYVIRRLLLTIPTLFSVSIIVFLMIRFIPGDIVDNVIMEIILRGGVITAEEQEVMREELEEVFGIDVPIYVQYGRWIRDIILHGSLGDSLALEAPVATRILERMPTTLELGLLSIVSSLIIALPVGIYSAIRQDTGLDYLGRTIAIMGLAIPNFWLATMVIVFPAIWWGWTPPFQIIPFMENPLGNLKQFIIPSLILGTAGAAVTMRMTRTMMLEVLRQDYVRTAWAKGLTERVVVTRHALKNALIPVVTVVGAEFPVLVGGSLIIETIFSLPGVGRLFVTALQQRDYTMVAGINMVIATTIVVANLVVDLSYAYLDPRVRYT